MFSGLRIWRCSGLWCRLAAVALVQPIAGNLHMLWGAALKSKKKKKKKKKTQKKKKIKIELL